MKNYFHFAHSRFQLAGLVVGLVSLAAPLKTRAQYSPPLSGLVAWWRAEGNANDNAGTHNGTLLNGVTFAPGDFGQAFSFAGNPNSVFVPDNEDFNLTNSLSIGAWIYPKANSWVVLQRAGTTGGGAPYSFQLDNAGHFLFYIRNAAGTLADLTVPIAYNQWTQVTATFDGATGLMRLYFNGSVVAEKVTSLRPMEIDPAFLPAGIGIGNIPGGGGWPFIGLVDELVLYSRALSAAEVTNLVTGNGPPVITSGPKSQVGYWGGSATFQVTATTPTNAPILSYQWLYEGLPISWATNAALLLTNLDLSAGGHFSAVVANAFGSVTSAPALLVINPAGISLGLTPTITITGTVGKNFGIQYTTNVSETNMWTTLTNLTLAQPLQRWYDTDADVSLGNHPRRFYRVVAIP